MNHYDDDDGRGGACVLALAMAIWALMAAATGGYLFARWRG